MLPTWAMKRRIRRVWNRHRLLSSRHAQLEALRSDSARVRRSAVEWSDPIQHNTVQGRWCRAVQ